MSNKPKPGLYPDFEENRYDDSPVEQNDRPGSAGAPVGYSEVSILQKALKESSRKCFGGRIFTYKNHSDFPMVCHAVSNKILGNNTPAVSDWYHRANANGDGIFLHYEGSQKNSEWTFFKFTLPDGARSMREMMLNPERKGLCRNLFTDLVMLLYNYSMEFDNEYAPLCSISPDTVYCNPRGRVRLLPLFSVNNEYPRGFPLEAGTDEMNDTTDLYTAALLTHQVLSGFEYEKLSEHKRMLTLEEPACMATCLSLFASQRPTLKEVYNILTKGTSGDSPEGEPRPTNRRQPVPRDADGNPIRESRGTSLFATLRRNLTSILSGEYQDDSTPTAGRVPQKPKLKSVRNYFSSIDDEEEADDYDD